MVGRSRAFLCALRWPVTFSRRSAVRLSDVGRAVIEPEAPASGVLPGAAPSRTLTSPAPRRVATLIVNPRAGDHLFARGVERVVSAAADLGWRIQVAETQA